MRKNERIAFIEEIVQVKSKQWITMDEKSLTLEAEKVWKLRIKATQIELIRLLFIDAICKLK